MCILQMAFPWKYQGSGERERERERGRVGGPALEHVQIIPFPHPLTHMSRTCLYNIHFFSQGYNIMNIHLFCLLHTTVNLKCCRDQAKNKIILAASSSATPSPQQPHPVPSAPFDHAALGASLLFLHGLHHVICEPYRGHVYVAIRFIMHSSLSLGNVFYVIFLTTVYSQLIIQ